jgi:glycosyltransferase involved in cell wall biosynthesis
VRAAATILSSEPDARFVLVGDGADGARVRELARELRIEHAVFFAGRVPHADVVRYYDLIDVLVYPRLSKRVTELVTPLKPLEAMAQSKLVIASDVGGHREMVFSGQNGLLFKAGDPQSLAEACLELLRRRQDWKVFRENGRRYVREARSWKHNVGIYDRLYEELLAGSRARTRDVA